MLRPRSVLAIAAGIAITAASYVSALHWKIVYYDLTLHYFAGLVERSGTYTDTQQVFAAIADAHRVVPAEGVYGTPSLIALVFQPLSFLSFHHATLLWGAVACVALTFAIRKATAASKYWLVWLTLIVWSPAMVSAFNLGNFSMFTSALLFYCFGCLRAGQHERAGVALGAAIALKLFPGLLVFVLLFGRHRRALISCAITGAILWAVTPSAMGFHDAWEGAKSTLSVGGLVHKGPDNIGLPGFMLHLFGSSVLAKATAYVALIAAIGLMWRTRRYAAHQAFAVGLLAMFLAQSITWRHYLPVVFVAALALNRPRWTLKQGMVGFICMSLALSLYINVPVAFGASYEKSDLQVTVGLLGTLVLLLVKLHEERQSAEGISDVRD